MIDPIKIDPEELAGLEWSLDDLKEQDNEILVPRQSYINDGLNGTQSLRFLNFKKETAKKEDENETEYSFMNIEYNTEPIYDTDSDEKEIIFGFDEFEQEENDFSIIDYLEEEPSTGFKIEETSKTFNEIINKKFTQLNIQEEVDNMIIECITEL